MDSLQPYPATATISALFALLFFIYYQILRRRSASSNCKKRREAPQPDGAWPIIGHLPMLGDHHPSHFTLGTMADKYGPALTIQLGVRRALVVSSWELAKECFTTNDRVFATRPSSMAVKIMGYNYATFGFGPYGHYWREMRKIAMLELLSNRPIELFKHVWASEIDTSVKELYQMWMKNNINGSQGMFMVEMKQWFGDLTLNLTLRIIAGKRYLISARGACDEEEARRIQKAIRDFFHLVGLFVVSDALPFLGWLDLDGHQKAMKKTAKELDYFLQKWLEEHQRNKYLSREEQSNQDFMGVMLSILEDEKLFDFDSDTAIKSTCLSMILGGSDTITVTLIWALALLVNNPPILKKAQDEIDFHVGKDRLVDESDIKDLVYLQAIVKETLRLYPAGPLSAPHEAMVDCTVAGYHVPAGTKLIVNIWKIQRDPRVWSNPCEFKPDRFLTSHANVDLKGHYFELIPFGSGRRSCPGITLSLQVVHLTLARLLHEFEFEAPSNAPVDMTESPGLTNLKATPLDVIIKPRLSLKFHE